MTHRQKTHSTLGPLILVLVPLAACGREEPARTTRSMPVRVLEVALVDGYERSREFSGRVRPRREAQLGFEISGRIVEVLADDGDRCPKGRVLARLDATQVRAQLAQSRAQLASAEAEFAELEEGPRAERIAASRARLAEVQAQLTLAKLREKRARELERQEVSSTAQLDERTYARAALEKSVESAARALEELENGTRKTQLMAAKSRLASTRARVRELENEVVKHELRAPWNLIVRMRHSDEGQIATPGMRVLEVFEDAALEARLGVPVGIASDRLREGSTLACRVRGEEVSAKIRKIIPRVDARARTRTLVLDLEAHADEHPLKRASAIVSGAVLRASVEERIEARGAWIPMGALTRSRKGLWACYAVTTASQPRGVTAAEGEDDATREAVLRVQRREVEVLYSDGRRCFVRGTLRDGDRIVAEGTARLATRQRVTIEGEVAAPPERR